MYSITPQGLRALRGWLERPGTGPALEFEGALKLFFADQGTKRDALATVDVIEQWAAEMRTTGGAIARETDSTDGGPFPERLHVNALITELIWRHTEMIEDWVGWARAQIEDWDGTGAQPHRHELDMAPYRRRLK
jgi:hypothetical protein